MWLPGRSRRRPGVQAWDPRRPFPLLRYFTWISLAAFLAMGILAAAVVAGQFRQHLLAQKVQMAVAIARNLTEDLGEQVFRPAALAGDPLTPSTPYGQKLRQILADYIRRYGLRQINLINPDRFIAYSTNPKLTGLVGRDSPAFAAALQGRVGTKFMYHPDDRAETSLEVFVPVERDGRVHGVIMIYQDIRDVLAAVRRGQAVAAAAILGAMALLFAILFLVVHRAARILEAQRQRLQDWGTELEAQVAARTADLARLNSELERLARTDSLTGLPNRRQITAELATAFQAARARNRSISCLMMDIDHFKRLNDRFGHPFGDEVLRQVAEAIRTALGESGTVGRYGGEEFLAVLPGAGAEAAAEAAERIRRAVAGLRLASPAGEEVRLTISVGVSTVVRSAIDQADDLLSLADAALYDAKHKGRNVVCMAGGEWGARGAGPHGVLA